MHKFVRSLLTEWRRLELPANGETIVVAVSGGADSVSLLLALADLARRAKITNDLVVAHFDHRLRGDESRQDADFVKRLKGRGRSAMPVERVFAISGLSREGCQALCLAIYEHLSRVREPEPAQADVRFARVQAEPVVGSAPRPAFD